MVLFTLELLILSTVVGLPKMILIQFHSILVKVVSEPLGEDSHYLLSFFQFMDVLGASLRACTEML